VRIRLRPALRTLRHLGLERFELVITLDEIGDVVIGMEAASCGADALSNHL
jgi:hypothetical protein